MTTAPAAPLTLDALISELELERYREAFATAGVGDAELEAARAAGEEAIEALIQKVGLRGGSATKFRRRLLAKADAGGAAAAAAPPPRERKVRREAPEVTEPAEAALPVKDGLVIVRTQADLDRLFHESSVVVVEFRARWCGGCNKFAPTYTRMAPDVPAACLTMCDVDDSPDLAEKFGATQLPLFVVFRDGVKCDALVGGKATALRQKVQQAIDSRR